MPPDRRRPVRIGCSGWNYASWKDELYEGKPARLWLQHYAQYFDTVEVNTTFYRLRIMGSLALSLCHLAAGRVDAVCSLKAARSVDIAAAQLLVREAGLAIELFDDPRAFEEAELDLEGRSRVAAAGTAAVCRRIADALSA